MRLALACAAAALMVPEPGSAQTSTYRLELSTVGGYALNVLAASELTPQVREVDEGFWGVAPTAAISRALPADLRLSGGYQGELLRYADDEIGLRQWHQLWTDLSWRPRYGVLSLGAVGAAYSFRAFERDTFAQAGGYLSGGLRLSRLQVLLRLDIGRRLFAEITPALGEARDDLDTSVGITARAHLVSGLTGSLSYAYRARDTNDAAVASRYHTAGAALSWNGPRFEAEASYWLIGRPDQAGGEDLFHSFAAEVSYVVFDPLSVTARYRLSADRTGDDRLDFEAHELQVGLTLQLTWPASAVPPPPAPRQHEGRVHFRTHRPEAREVAVVGDFNEWDSTRGAMTDEDGDGWFETMLIIAPGRYEYQYLVDGEFVPPDDAVQLVPSGFGSNNGILVVEPGLINVAPPSP